MKLDYDALDALAAVLNTGSFDRAAAQLGLTQPAISQRIRGLEDRVGAILVRRGRPSVATDAGARLLRHAEEVGLLESGLIADLGGEAQAQNRPVRIAVNADSLATWVIPALAATKGFLYDLTIDDQDHSAEWLRRGEVSAAITSSPGPIPGCDATPLGALPYAATCAPGFFAKWFSQGVTTKSLSVAPCLIFSRKDRLQQNWADKAAGGPVRLPAHFLPSAHEFITAARLGMGWGMNPLPLAQSALNSGDLVELIPGRHSATQLYWQVTRQTAGSLKPLTRALKSAAKTGLTAP